MMPRSLSVLLEGAIDYAGMFPPAKLEIEAAVEHFVRYQAGRERWIVSRFVVNAARLEELARLVPGERYRFAVVCESSRLDEALAQIRSFGSRADTIEIKFSGGDVREFMAAKATALSGLDVYIEVPISHLDSLILAIGEAGYGKVKVRTGGLQPDAFPSVEELSKLVCECAKAGVSFKATAGLHQPLRHFDAALGVWMHGFLNLFAAGCIAHAHKPAEEALSGIVAEQDSAQFAFGEDGMRYKEHWVDIDEIAAARKFVISFGSCSVDEPLEGLAALGYS
jgi:hypothetical protein